MVAQLGRAPASVIVWRSEVRILPAAFITSSVRNVSTVRAVTRFLRLSARETRFTNWGIRQCDDTVPREENDGTRRTSGRHGRRPPVRVKHLLRQVILYLHVTAKWFRNGLAGPEDHGGFLLSKKLNKHMVKRKNRAGCRGRP